MNYIDNQHTGAWAELRASAYFLQQGLSVYRNVAASGAADIITLNPETGETVSWDVKFVNNGELRVSTRTTKQGKLGVRLLYVNSNSGYCSEYYREAADGMPASNRDFKLKFKQ
jgi:hypothetical protein